MVRLVMLAALITSGCCCRSEPKTSNVQGARVVSPDGKVTATATAVFNKGHAGVHSGVSDSVVHLLELQRGGETQRVRVREFDDGYLGSSPAEFEAAKNATLRVKFEPDGHAVSVSADEGKTWSHVVLDEGAPFVCGRSPGSTAAPKTRDLVLSNLRAAGFGTRRTCDVEGATRVLCAHGDDEELWAVALTRMLEQQLVDAERAPLVTCLSPLVKQRALLREQLLGSLTAPESARVELAAEALARSADEGAQAALTRALEHAAPTDSRQCWTTATMVWALASITIERNAADGPTRALLVDVARRQTWPREPGCVAARVYAVAALGAVKDESLRELSATCSTTAPPWTLGFKQSNEAVLEGLTDRPIDCLAKAKLAP